MVPIIVLVLFTSHLNASNWAHEITNLPRHPDLSYARLENGFSYAWHKKARTGANASCQILHVDVGSNQEESDERGMAHMIEHMAFKASNISSDLIQEMQNLGLSFGAHNNAHTIVKPFLNLIYDPCRNPTLLKGWIQGK